MTKQVDEKGFGEGFEDTEASEQAKLEGERDDSPYDEVKK